MLRRFLHLAPQLALGLAAVMLGNVALAEESAKQRLYFGTYTTGNSKGIYTAELDLSTGVVTKPVLVAEAMNASFLAIAPSHKYLYAVGEISEFDGKKVGVVHAYSINKATGELQLLNRQSSAGAGPCHVSVHPQGSYVFAANYGGGSICALPVKDNGSLGEATGFVQHTGSGPNQGRQKEPHAHSINPDAAGKFVFAADLGIDKVLIYKLDPSTGKLVANDPAAGTVPPGSGPRHFAFHPSGKFAYAINELTSTITAYAYDAEKGALAQIDTISTLPAGFSGNNSTAEIQVHPSGKFVYGSNRGHNSIAIFTVDEKTGKLAAVGHTEGGIDTPRNFGVDPTGQWVIVCNQGGKSAFVYKVNQETGILTRTGEAIEIDAPVCVKFLPL